LTVDVVVAGEVRREPTTTTIWREYEGLKDKDFDIFVFVTNQYPHLVIFWRFIELPKRLKGFALG